MFCLHQSTCLYSHVSFTQQRYSSQMFLSIPSFTSLETFHSKSTGIYKYLTVSSAVVLSCFIRLLFQFLECFVRSRRKNITPNQTLLDFAEQYCNYCLIYSYRGQVCCTRIAKFRNISCPICKHVSDSFLANFGTSGQEFS